MEKIYIVYTITFQGKVMYVGKTYNFTARKWYHLNYRGTHYSAIPVDINQNDLTYDIVYSTENELDALKEEDRLIVEYDTINSGWNKLRSGHVRIDNNTEYQRIHGRLYRKKNRENYNEYARNRLREIRKDPIKRLHLNEKGRVRSKRYYENHKNDETFINHRREKNRENWEKHKDEYNRKRREKRKHKKSGD